MKDPIFFDGLNRIRQKELDSVFKLARRCNYETNHSHLVTKLSLQFFDGLKEFGTQKADSRFYLLCAGILHDIGVHTEGHKKHHKTALKIILSSPILQISQKERYFIGSIARYHRKALPSTNHDHFAVLNKRERILTAKLAGLLRTCDGLDYDHRNRVIEIRVEDHQDNIQIFCVTAYKKINKEIRSARKKSYLFSLTFNKEIEFIPKYT